MTSTTPMATTNGAKPSSTHTSWTTEAARHPLVHWPHSSTTKRSPRPPPSMTTSSRRPPCRCCPGPRVSQTHPTLCCQTDLFPLHLCMCTRQHVLSICRVVPCAAFVPHALLISP